MLVSISSSLFGLCRLWILFGLRCVFPPISRALVGHLAGIGRALGFPRLSSFFIGSNGIPGVFGRLTVIAL